VLDCALCQATTGDRVHSQILSQHHATEQHLQGSTAHVITVSVETLSLHQLNVLPMGMTGAQWNSPESREDGNVLQEFYRDVEMKMDFTVMLQYSVCSGKRRICQ